MSFSKIGSRLNIDATSVWNHWKQFEKFGPADGQGGRPTILSDDQGRAIDDYSSAELHVMRLALCNCLIWFPRSEFHLEILPDSLAKMLRCNPDLRPILGQPMEMQRAQASADTITEYFGNIEHVANGIGSDCAWNMDETAPRTCQTHIQRWFMSPKIA
jgi:hypothetical protein